MMKRAVGLKWNRAWSVFKGLCLAVFSLSPLFLWLQEILKSVVSDAAPRGRSQGPSYQCGYFPISFLTQP